MPFSRLSPEVEGPKKKEHQNILKGIRTKAQRRTPSAQMPNSKTFIFIGSYIRQKPDVEIQSTFLGSAVDRWFAKQINNILIYQFNNIILTLGVDSAEFYS